MWLKRSRSVTGCPAENCDTVASLGTKSIDNAANRTGLVYHQNIEAHRVAAPLRMSGEQDFGRSKQTRLLSGCKRSSGIRQRRPRLYLDDCEQTLSFGNKINFAGLGAQAAAVNSPAVLFQRTARCVLGRYAQHLRAPAASLAEGFAHRRAASSAARRKAAIRLDGLATPSPAISYAVPWSGEVRTMGNPRVTFTPWSMSSVFSGISP